MNMSKPSSMTAEEAVARLINLDYTPSGFTITEMTAAYLEMAEVEYDNARAEHRPRDQISGLKIQLEACQARHSLAESLMEAICHEIDKPEGSTIVHSSDAGLTPRVTPDSVSDWAFEFCGICMPEWSRSDHDNAGAQVTVHGISWEDVKIKIYADFNIGCYLGKDNYQKSSFQKIGLMGSCKNQPNALGGLLLGLSQNKKFPTGSNVEAKHKTAISKLRKSLLQLTGITEDPFIPFNSFDGWKPRFELIDDRQNADDRAKKNARHVSLDEARDATPEDDDTDNFEREDDPAQKWLDEQRNPR